MTGRRARVTWGSRAVVIGFIGPTLAFFILWVFGPAIYGLYLSLTNASLIAPPQFIGLANYGTLFSSSLWWASVGRTVAYAAEVVIAALVLSWAMARLTMRAAHGRAVFMTVYFLPYVIPGVASALVFDLLFQRYGVINQGFHLSIPWLTDPSTALYAVSIATIWSFVGYYTVIFMAGYQQLPKDLTEAALIDGANVGQLIWYVELPMLRPTILFSTVTAVAAVLSNFATPFVMTQGGPGRATTTLPLLIYDEAFSYSSAGLGEAMALVLLVASIIITAIQLRLLRSR